jgi:hypothetical protein
MRLKKTMKGNIEIRSLEKSLIPLVKEIIGESFKDSMSGPRLKMVSLENLDCRSPCSPLTMELNFVVGDECDPIVYEFDLAENISDELDNLLWEGGWEKQGDRNLALLKEALLKLVAKVDVLIEAGKQ